MSANPIKGEVAFEALGATHVLKLDYNALCTMEAEIPGDHGGDLAAMLRGPSNIRTAFRVGLQAHHDGISDAEVGNLLTDMGLLRARALLQEALSWSMPPPAEPKDGAPRPPKAPRGRGGASGKTTS